MIVVLSEPDTHCDAMVAELDRRGVETCVVAHSNFPEASLTMRLLDGLQGARIIVDQQVIDLAAVDAMWFRRPGSASPAATVIDPVARALVASETNAVCDDLWDTLGVPSVPAPRHVYRRAAHRALQLRTATEVGLEIPPTLVTNDPDELLDFARQGWSLVSKQAGTTPSPERGGELLLRFTDHVRPTDLLNIEALRLCPVMIQAEIPKALELRVTVVGDCAFAAAIDSQRSHRSSLDWRHYDHRYASTSAYALPSSVAQRCVAVARALGLTYGAIDLVLTPDGRFVFLEINPNGQFLWIEELTGLPITSAIADVLCGTNERERRAS